MNRKRDEPETFDSRQRRAERERAEAERIVYEWSFVPPSVREHLARPAPAQQSQLELSLDALVADRPLRGPLLPPAALAGKYDVELEQRIREADRACSEAISLAMQWQAAEPGGIDFSTMLAADDELEIIEFLGFGRYRGWLAAWRAQLAGRAADAAVRSYGATTAELHERLTSEMAELVDKIGARLEKVQGRGDQRIYDEALALIEQWAVPAALVQWCRNPRAAFVTYGDHVKPPEVEYRAWDAAGKLTGTHQPIVPAEAFDAPRARESEFGAFGNEGTTITTNEGTTVAPMRRGFFGRG